MKKILVIMVLFAAFTTGLTAQVLKPVKWQITQKKVDLCQPPSIWMKMKPAVSNW